jgi:hypothetical protein
MTQEPKRDRPSRDPLTGALEYLVTRGRERREKMIAEIQANRRGEYKVPTWVLALALVTMIAAICSVVFLV